MSAYPGFKTLSDSTALPESGVEPVRATNGSLRVRRLWSADKISFDIGHVLAAGDKATLDAFYAANKDADVSYTWPKTGATHTVRFVAPPRYTPRTHVWEVRVRLMEV
jgi:hypothetical protein